MLILRYTISTAVAAIMMFIYSTSTHWNLAIIASKACSMCSEGECCTSDTYVFNQYSLILGFTPVFWRWILIIKYPCNQYSLCSEGECCTSDATGQVEAFADLPPKLLVDDLHQASLGHNQSEEFVQVQGLLGHDGNTVHWGTYKRTERIAG